MEDEYADGERKNESEKGGEGERAIRLVQRALRGEQGLKEVGTALSYIAEHQSWREVGFSSFGEFALAQRKKHGLEIDTVDSAKTLRYHLLKTKRYELWGEVFELIKKPRGRPKNNDVNDGNKRQFYPCPKASTDRDNLISKLRLKDPDRLAAASAGRVTLRQAALELGIVKQKELLLGAFSLERVKKLKPMDQATLLSNLFGVVALDAQCELFRRRVDKKLKQQLARRWREVVEGQVQPEGDEELQGSESAGQFDDSGEGHEPPDQPPI